MTIWFNSENPYLLRSFLWQDKMHIFPEWDLRWHENEETTTKFGFSRS